MNHNASVGIIMLLYNLYRVGHPMSDKNMSTKVQKTGRNTRRSVGGDIPVPGDTDTKDT